MKLIVLFCVISYVCAEFEDFKKKHKKNYKSAADEAVAKEHYARHMQFYEQHNAKYKAGQVPFQVGPNKFADQNGTDLISKICRTVQSKISTALPFMRDATQYPPGPAAVNWTSIMQSITDQGCCGSCWAFATVAQLESLYTRKTSQSYQLSQQFLVDCSMGLPTGCDGSSPLSAMCMTKTKVNSNFLILTNLRLHTGVWGVHRCKLSLCQWSKRIRKLVRGFQLCSKSSANSCLHHSI